MAKADRKFVILSDDEVSLVDFSEVLETSEATLRWDNDNTKTFVKYEGSKPRFLYGKDTLTHSQILTELANDEWIGEVP